MQHGKVWRKVRKELWEFRQFLWELVLFIVINVKRLLYEKTLPVTKRLLSRRPKPPRVSVKDVRAKRIRLNIESSFSSPFNVEEFEVEWQPADGAVGAWQSVGKNDLTARTVARLKPDTLYAFRVRAINGRGVSGWTEPVEARTKLGPVDGGGYGPGGPDSSYSWTQNATEACIMFKLPSGANKKDIDLKLKPDALTVTHQAKVVLEGELYGTVRSWDNGSFWELTKERDHVLLSVTLEKQVKSLAPKFDYWRSFVLGHPEIDTHQIVSEANQATQMLHPSQMDPHQLHNMGLGNLYGGGGGFAPA